MEIVKLIGSDVLPDDQKLMLEIAKCRSSGLPAAERVPQGRYLRTHGEAVQDDGADPLSEPEGEGADSDGHAHVGSEERESFLRKLLP